MPNIESLQVHLVADSPPDAVIAGVSHARAKPLPVPAGPATVVTVPCESPRLVPGVNPLANGAVVVEQLINSRRQIRLLAVNPRGEPLRINGHAAPRVAVLGEQDSLQLPDETTVHVTFFNRPYIGKPPPELLGRPCPVCRVPFTENATVYICPCGIAMHNSADGDVDGLQCTRLPHACLGCERPIRLKEGFTYWPDLVHA